MTQTADVPPVSKKKKGLSILTTLVVLAGVVLCLGAIATPKFAKFGCKSKQSEAKTNLSGIFTAQKAFFGEYNCYTTDLVSMNWAPDGSPIYAYGFAAPSTTVPATPIPGYDATRRTTIDPRVAGSKFSSAKMKTLSGRVLTDADFQSSMPTATVTNQKFVAVAIGDVDSDGSGDEQLDVWTIDEAKSLNVVSNDCTQ